MAPRHPRYDSLDLWRGVACLIVVAYHAAAYVHTDDLDARMRAGGSVGELALVAVGRFWFGVPMFFVISGYCIAASADAARGKPGGAGRFFARRLWRIYPPLWAVTAFGFGVALVLGAIAWPGLAPDGRPPLVDPGTLTGWHWVGNLTLTEEWRPAAAGPDRHYFLGQLWTLCYEEQFYLVVGLLLAVAPRWFFPGVWAVTGLVLLNVADLNAAVGNRVGLDLNGWQLRVPGLFTDGLWLSFAAGVAVYYRWHRAEPGTGTLLEVLLWVAAAAAVCTDPDPFGPRKTLAKLTAVGWVFAVVLCRLWRHDAALSAARWAAPLRYCGRRCYSLYLVHPLVAVPVAWAFFTAGLTGPWVSVLVMLPLATLLSAGLGDVFYRVVERRFFGGAAGGRTAPVPSAPAAAETRPGTPAPCPA